MRILKTRLPALFGVAAIMASSLAAVTPVKAEDNNTTAFVRLFSLSCMANGGVADRVRAFAHDKRFLQTMEPSILEALFVDPAGMGEAWELPSPTAQYFVLGMEANPGVCSVAAEEVNQAELITVFRDLAANFEKSGATAKVEKDETFKTKTGEGHVIWISTRSAEHGNFFFALQVGDQAKGIGSPFQATLRVSPFVE